ncbi:MAG: hypothetical protein AAB343_04225 [Patescibacteria group bacterium]
MKKQNAIIIFIILVAVGALWYAFLRTNKVETPFVGYVDATYNIEGRVVTLMNGQSSMEAGPESAARIETKIFGNEVRGDFDSDGDEDIAFLLTQSSGGSGTFFYAVVALKEEMGYRGTNAILLGDRIAPRTTEYRDGAIIVNFADRADGEPITTRPSIGKSLYFNIDGTSLREIQR